MRVEVLARRLGVTKGGFYWHFDDRRELLDAILDRWEETSVSEVIERVEAGGGDARERLRRLFAIAASSRAFLRADLAVRDWSRREPRVAERLRRVAVWITCARSSPASAPTRTRWRRGAC